MIDTDYIREKILDLAMRGKLVDQNPMDEPASKLLERIEAEKELLIKEKKIKKEKPLPEITENEIPYEIPDSWEWVRLGDIGSWEAGSTPSRSSLNYYQNGSIPWLKTGDLNNGVISCTSELITQEGFDNSSMRLNPIGSVLIAMYGATIGKTGILNIEAATNQACCACIPFNGIYNNFLFYFLCSNKYNFIKLGSGGAQPNISRNKIINFLFSLPPIEEQKRIVEEIERAFELLDIIDNSQKEILDLADTLKSKVLDLAMSGKLVEQDENDTPVSNLLDKDLYLEIKNFQIPNSRTWRRLGEEMEIYTGNSIPKKVKEENYTGQNSGYNYIATKDIGFDSIIDYNNGIKIPFEESNKFRMAKKGTPLLCIEGGSAGRKIGLLEEDVAFVNKLCNFVPYWVYNKYIYYFLKSYLFIKQFETEKSGLIGGVGIFKIRNMVFPLPPIEEQKRIVEKIEEIFNLIDLMIA